MAVKFKLQPNPTFKAPVDLYKHGETVPVAVLFEFKHRTLDAYDEWRKTFDGRPLGEVLAEAVVGWDLDDEFCRENVDFLVQNYGAAFGDIMSAYTRELIQARRGN